MHVTADRPELPSGSVRDLHITLARLEVVLAVAWLIAAGRQIAGDGEAHCVPRQVLARVSRDDALSGRPRAEELLALMGRAAAARRTLHLLIALVGHVDDDGRRVLPEPPRIVLAGRCPGEKAIDGEDARLEPRLPAAPGPDDDAAPELS